MSDIQIKAGSTRTVHAHEFGGGIPETDTVQWSSLDPKTFVINSIAADTQSAVLGAVGGVGSTAYVEIKDTASAFVKNFTVEITALPVDNITVTED